MKKAPRGEPREASRLGALPLIYLGGRALHGLLPPTLRRETGDSNPGRPRLIDVAGLEPAGLTDSDACRNYRALFGVAGRK